MKDSDKLVRDKIEGLNIAPDERFDKDAAWSKLAMRLDNKTSPKRLQLYYGAAATLVILCFTFLFVYNRKEDTAQQPLSVKNPVATDRTIPEPGTVENNLAEVALSKTNPRQAKEMASKLVQGEPRDEIVLQTDTATQIAGFITDTPVSIPPVLATKQMKVLHINDITSEPQTFRPPQPEGFITIAEHRLYKNSTPAGYQASPETQRTFTAKNFLYE